MACRMFRALRPRKNVVSLASAAGLPVRSPGGEPEGRNQDGLLKWASAELTWRGRHTLAYATWAVRLCRRLASGPPGEPIRIETGSRFRICRLARRYEPPV